MSSYKQYSESVTNQKISVKYKKKGKAPVPPIYHGSDSDQSADTNSCSTESQDLGKLPTSTGHKTTCKKGEWEILEGLKEGQRFEFRPRKFEGYLLKRRKWPLKGWHKRFFVLDQSLLTYYKSTSDLNKGKLHGSMDIGLSVISTKARRRRIDIDADSSILHLKCKSRELYMQWVEQLKQHRLHKQHQLLYTKDPAKISDPNSPSDVSPTDPLISSGISSMPSSLHGTLRRDRKLSQSNIARDATSLASGGTFRSWLVDTTTIDKIGSEIHELQSHLDHLAALVENVDDNSQGGTPSTKKRGKFRLRKNKSNKSAGIAAEIPSEKSSTNRMTVDSVDNIIVPTSLSVDGNLVDLRPLSSSNPSLPLKSAAAANSFRPHSCSDAWASASDAPNHPPLLIQQPPAISLDARFLPKPDLREEYSKNAKQIVEKINSIVKCFRVERDKARQVFEAESTMLRTHNTTSVIATLRNSLTQTLQQNVELRRRLCKIHEDSNIFDICPTLALPTGADSLQQALQTSLSYDSSTCFSASEYYDAEDGVSDVGASDTSSEVTSDNSSFTSDASDDAGTDAQASTTETGVENKCFTGRRTRLAAPKPPSEDFSPFKFLYKSIGKDLSKVSMPVSINEPLNMLQRLCEELEYSELLDKAASLDDPAERMVQVAAFAVSSYAASIYRAAHKPFNPILGETYECIREDKGFRFIAEQVSHDPPISACYAKNNNFTFWQDVRIKTKFWGRSLEFQPSGTVYVSLPNHDDHYEWNKVTSCVHNLYGGGQRWVDQYGEMIITNKNQKLSCKLSFVKANSWSSKHHEVFGTIASDDGMELHNLFGKWTEALYCGHAPSARVVWRPGSMPEDYHLYYGFTRFAIELNEVDPDQAKYLPPTDTRFRPDQRMLEEGNFTGAGATKLQLEQLQRERRKAREEDGVSHVPMWFRRELKSSGDETWIFAGDYWNKRKDPGFVNMSFEPVW